jgi:vitamin B12 transporter
MTNPISRAPFRARLSILVLAALTAGRALAQSAPLQLEGVVTTATRTPSALPTLGTAVDQINYSDLAREQLSSFADALGTIAGAPIFATGQRGASASIFMRGANSNQVLFLVDGIRLNDPNTDYGPFLNGARVCSCDSLEVAHGPQSTLYGGEAIGGVIALSSQKGTGAPAGAVSVEAGSFGTIQGAIDAKGTRDLWAYNVSASGGTTENDRPNNRFTSSNLAARVDRTVTASVEIGATLRSFIGKYGDPGDKYTNDPDNYEEEANWLGTLFANFKFAPDWIAKVTLGGQDRRFIAVTPKAGFPTSINHVLNHRGVLDAQTTYSGIVDQRLTLGVTGEIETTSNDGFGSIDKRQQLFAVFAQDEWHVLKDVYLTGGLRHDDFDTFGSATTGRVTAAWLVADNAIKLRSSYGTGFRTPAFLDLYGKSSFYVGNPNLKPESSRGWDAGVDYYLPEGKGTLSATWFRTDYSNLIEYNFAVFPGTTINVERARTKGVELTGKFNLPSDVVLHVAYTYLDAYDLTTNTRLLRRPRNSASADLSKEFAGVFTLGAGVQLVRDRKDVDAKTFATVEDPNYSVARLFASYKVTDRLTLKARVENALDRVYEPVNGYPALRLGVFGGAEYRF